MKKLKLPGLIDPHVHLRDPGSIEKEDFESGTKAAIAGGFVAVLDMPNNSIPTISKETLSDKKRIASAKAVCDWGLIFGASQNDNTYEYPDVENDVAALKVYMDTTTGDLLLDKLDVLERTFKSWKSNKPIIVHAENSTLAKAIGLSAVYGKHLHVAHLSQKSELQLVMDAKNKGLTITCEATPHHLFLSEKDSKSLGAFGEMKPPLRKREDVDFLWKYIDAIDCIATDHAPHTIKEKKSKKPAYGVTGLETSLPLMLTAVHTGIISLDDVVRLMHKGPKTIFNITIPKDSFVQVDLNARYKIQNDRLLTKSKWSPFDNEIVHGKVLRTVIRGTKVYNGEEVMVKPGFGIDLYE